MKDRYDKLMIQYGGSIPFKVLAKEQEKERKELMKDSKSKKRDKKRNKRKKANTRRKKKPSKNKSKCESNCKCDSRCNVTDGNNMNNPNALGYCSYCVPDGVMIKGKDGQIYRNKKKEWIKI